MLITRELIHNPTSVGFDIKATRTKVATEPLQSIESPERIALNANYRQAKGLPFTGSAIERSIEGDDTIGTEFIERGLRAKRSVARIRINMGGRQTAYGTGFLVAPNILLTNHHVISDQAVLSKCELDFGYETDSFGRERTPFIFKLDSTVFFTSKELDFTLVGVCPRTVRGDELLPQFGYLPLNPEPGKILVKQFMSVIQHPQGKRKRLAIRENRLIHLKEHHLWYYSDTEPGSSGSPVFNDAWEVVGLHHSGVVKQDEQGRYLRADGQIWDGKTPIDDSLLAWIANEAVRVSSIYELLREHRSDPGIEAVLTAHTLLATTPTYERKSFPKPASPSVAMDQPYHINIPITIVIGNGSGANTPVSLTTNADGQVAVPTQQRPSIPAPKAESPTLPAPASKRKSGGSEVLAERYTGSYDGVIPYNPNHIPDSHVVLPEPRDPDLQKQVLSYQDEQGNTKQWLDYIHFSVLMSKPWKFAIATAVNINGDEEQTKIPRRKWYYDNRIEREAQFEPDIDQYYGTKTMNRGHMVRREDPIWGDMELAKKASDFTFHLTNSVPQAASLNQKRWLGLEDFIKNQAWNENQQVSVFTGPVLLESEENKSAGWFGTYKGTPIPMAFWKVVAYPDAKGQLRSAAFLMNQVVDVDLLELDYAHTDEPEIQVSQLTLTELSKRTGLRFDEQLYGGDAYARQVGTDMTEAAGQAKAITNLRRDVVI